MLAGFFGRGHSILNLIPLLKVKEKNVSNSLPMTSWLHGSVSPTLLGRRSPGGDRVHCKNTDVTTRHIRLIGHYSLIWHRLSEMWTSSRFSTLFCGRGLDLQWERSRYTLLRRLNKVANSYSSSFCHMQCLLEFLVMVI